jgi:hypothetical protein
MKFGLGRGGKKVRTQKVLTFPISIQFCKWVLKIWAHISSRENEKNKHLLEKQTI